MDLNGFRRLAFATLLASGAANATPPTPSPVAQAQAEVAALLANDVAALFEAGQRDGLVRFARDWEAARERRRGADPKREAPAPDSVRRDWTLLLDDEGTESLVREWHASLASGPGGAASGKVSIAVAGLFGKAIADPSRTPAERAALMDAMRGAQAWAMQVDWTDPERLRRAVGALAKAVRATGVDSPDAFLDLPFEDALAHFDGFLAAAKAAALAYDLDIDAILRSHRVREVMREGDTATLSAEFTVFGVPLAQQTTMVWRDGVWMDTARARAVDERIRRGTSEDAVTREVRERPTFGSQPAFPLERRPEAAPRQD